MRHRKAIIGILGALVLGTPALGQTADGKIVPEIRLLLQDANGNLRPDILDFPAIMDGGNGIAESTLNGNDIVVTPFGGAVAPRGFVILAGPDGVIQSFPGGDDLIVYGTPGLPRGFAGDPDPAGLPGSTTQTRYKPAYDCRAPSGGFTFTDDNGYGPSWDGFSEEPTPRNLAPEAECYDIRDRVRAPINHGKVTVVYLIDSDGYIDPNDPVILFGPDGTASTTACGDDEQLLPVGSHGDPNAPFITAGPNGILDTLMGTVSGCGGVQGDDVVRDSDDSLLYVAMDICNGCSAYNLTGALGSWRTDFGIVDPNDGSFRPLPPLVPNLCQYGLPASIADPNTLSWCMVPFDGDGDGSPNTNARLPWLAEDDSKFYSFKLYLRPPLDGVCNTPGMGDETRLWVQLEMNANKSKIEAERASPPDEPDPRLAHRINDERQYLAQPAGERPDNTVHMRFRTRGEPNQPLTPTELAYYGQWPPDGTNANDITGWGDDCYFSYLHGEDPNQCPLDIEFTIPRVDSRVTRMSGLSYRVVRQLLARATIETHSDTNGDQSPEDIAYVTWAFDVPELEVRKFIRCEGDLDWLSDPNAPLLVTSGAIVETKLEVENLGNTNLDVTLLDQVVSLCDQAKLYPITTAIIDGGNGVANSTVLAGSDDIQVVPPGSPVTPGGIVILPGPNGTVESSNTADDRKVNTTMTVSLFRDSDAIVDGGNGVANSTKTGDDIKVVDPNQPVVPGGAVILPGPNGVLDSPLGGDDVKVRHLQQVVVDGGDGRVSSLTVAHGDDIRVPPVGDPNVPPHSVIILPGPNGVIDPNTTIGGDDFMPPTQLIVDGGNLVANTGPTAGDDLQVVPLGHAVVEEGPIVLPGPDGALNTTPVVDDVPADARARATVTFANAVALGFNLNFFGGPQNNQFLVDIRNGVAKRLGTLNGLSGFDTGRYTQGDRVVITFKTVVQTDPDFCVTCPLTAKDVENRITAWVDSNTNLSRDPNELGDSPGVVDTPEELAQGFDDNVVSANVLCSPLSCDKSFNALWDADADCEPGPRTAGPGPSGYVDWTSQLDLRDKLFPVLIGVRVTSGNSGTVPIDATATDPNFIACVLNTAGADFADVIYQPAGPAGIANTTASPDDRQIIALNAAAAPGDVIITPGPNRVLNTNPVADDQKTAVIVKAVAGAVVTVANVADVQVVAVGAVVPAGTVIIAPGVDGVLNTVPAPASNEVVVPGCEFGQPKVIVPAGSASWFAYVRVDTAAAMRALTECLGPGHVIIQPTTGAGVANTTAAGTDVQVISPPNAAAAGAVIVAPGADGVLDTEPVPDDEEAWLLENTVTINGNLGGVCGPGFSTSCRARILAPPECEFEVTKQVQCIVCPNGAVVDPPPGGDWLRMAPDACARFTIEIANTSPYVKLPLLCIQDLLSAAGWMPSPNVTATLVAPLNNVLTCVEPKFSTALGAGARDCYWFSAYNGQVSCRPAAPWIAPGETLTITFDVTPPALLTSTSVVGEKFSGGNLKANTTAVVTDWQIVEPNDPVGAGGVIVAPGPDGLLTTSPAPDDIVTQWDLVNAVQVEGYTEVCSPTTPEMACSLRRAAASIDVKTPAICCLKTISVDYGNDGSVEVSPSDYVQLTGVDDPSKFPLALIYAYSVSNCGEVPLTGVQLCDPNLVAAANAVGATFDVSCVLDPVTGCADLGTLKVPPEVPNSVAVSCKIVFATKQQVRDFMDEDGPGGNPPCFTNYAHVSGTPDYTGICPPATILPVGNNCQATVCLTADCCPPIVKLLARIWNTDEWSFETERCICAWDQRLLSRFTEGGTQVNTFLRTYLQTDRGRARFDGLRNVPECGPDSVDAPLLGLAVKRLRIDAGGNNLRLAGEPLGGLGAEAGRLVVGIRAATASPPDGGGETTVVLQRSAAGQMGSLLVFPDVEVRWDQAGELIQDTFIHMYNDYPDTPSTQTVNIQMLFVNGDAPCNFAPQDFVLTKNDDAYWSAATGLPMGFTAFPDLVPGGLPDVDPNNPNGKMVRGYVLAWAVDPASGNEIQWNYLGGSATVVRYNQTAAWEYGAWAFKALVWPPGTVGGLLTAPYGQLDLDGVEYEAVPSQLLLDFFAPGAVMRSNTAHSVVVDDTWLTIWAAWQDYTP